MKDIKAILFDVDGVLIRLPYYFSRKLELKGYKKVEDSLNAYYCGSDHLSSLEGRADSKEMIIPYLRNFGWEYSVDEYFEQQFCFELEYIDRDMICFIDKLRAQGVKCCLASDQEKHRARYLLKSMDLRTVFDTHFISFLIGARKCHDLFWEHVVKELKNTPVGIEPDEIAFFDDIQKNIDTALRFGVNAFLFESVPQFREDMALLGLNAIHGYQDASVDVDRPPTEFEVRYR